MPSTTENPTPVAGTVEDAALSAYLYTYPLVTMEVTRRQSTVFDPSEGVEALVNVLLEGAPTNQLARVPLLPNAEFSGVVRPNVDTIYTHVFFDVSNDPLLITVPDMGDRYHLYQVMDMWTEVVGAPGTRTLPGVPGYTFAIVGPSWEGTLPDGVLDVRTPTDTGWMLGRIEVEPGEDLAAVRALQRATTVALLTADGRPRPRFREPVPQDLSVTEFLHDLSAQEYWDFHATALSHDQPHAVDADLLRTLADFGWRPEARFDLDELSADDRRAWEGAWENVKERVQAPLGDDVGNGWTVARDGIGRYGTDYEARAVVAFNGLGANLPEDAVYPATEVDALGRPLHSDRDHVLHFAADELPPVRAFWSLTLYDEQGFLVDNELDRYAVRGEQVVTNEDGSIDVVVSAGEPEERLHDNWLPAPTSSGFNLMLRLYQPRDEVVDGRWNPPAVTERT